jgi:ATP/maltotriose-dependent transcriptional regulator MalT
MENLIHLAKMSYAAGDMEKAKASATELLRLAPDRQYLWDYGNAIHDGNLVLGRVALHDGNIEAAKKYLLEAGKTPGSPQLNSSGPNMSLANDLLNKGEKDTVVAYFQLCGNFWTLSRGPSDLKTWTEEVKAGQIPHFGGNLYY